MKYERNAARFRTAALLIFGLGVVLLIRLVLVALPEEREPTPTALANPVAVPTVAQVHVPLPNSPVPVATIALPTPLGEATREVTLAPAVTASAFVVEELTASVAPSSMEPTVEITATTEPSVVTPTAATASPTASATAAPTPSGPTPTLAGRLVNNRIDPPWWPCAPNAIKAEPKLGVYYPPDHPRYSAVYVGVTCFPSVAAAQAAGYVEGP